jgi:AGZA family xanthine/uracil permease-like MFS transporter
VSAVAGLLSLLVGLIPRAVLAPIFIYVGFEIIHQAYRESPEAHSPAVSISFLPTVANLVMIILGQYLGALSAVADKLPARLQGLLQTLTALSNGFILTALLWGSMLAFIIDRRPRPAASCAFACAALTLFGLIHSILPSGEVYVPWSVSSGMHYSIAAGYGLMGLVLLVFRKEKGFKL